MADILVALWTIPHNQNWKRSWKVRALDMRSSLERLDHLRLAHAGSLQSGAYFQAIFLAPEYYFTDRSPQGKRLPLSDSDRRSLEDTLLGYSSEFGKILIVPGSAFYVKPMERGADPRAQLKFNPATGKRDLPKDPAPDHRRQHVLQQVESAINAVRGTTLAPVATKWTAMEVDPTGKPHLTYWDPSHTWQIHALIPPLELVRDRVEKAQPRIARNATYALLGGRRFAKYDKHGDFFEADGKPDDMVFVPGTKDQCPVIGGYRFGFEICYDHACGSLKKRGVADIAFHLVVSDMVETKTGNMAMMKGGYFLHASTAYGQTCVHRRDEQGNLRNLTGDKKYRISHEGHLSEWLDVYQLPLPPAKP